MRENLDDSLELMFGHEGGYVNVKTDRGGPTKYGITHKTLAAHRGVPAVSAAQVKAMTIKEAETIYRQSYWGPSGGDMLPTGLDYAVFDMGVNSGPPNALKTLQRVLSRAGLYAGKIDGWLGEMSRKAVADYPGGATELIKDYCAERMAFLLKIKGKQGFDSNGRGWTIRVTGIDPKGEWDPVPGVIGNALSMAAKQPVSKVEPPKAMEKLVSEEGSAKAEPAINAWTKPEVLLPIGSAAVAGGGGLASAAAPAIMSSTLIQAGITFAIVVAVLLGAYFAFTRIRKTA